MPIFRISVVNDSFCAISEHDCQDFEAARKQGVAGALAMGMEAIAKGREFFGAEVRVDQGHEPPRRFVISVAAQALKT